MAEAPSRSAGLLGRDGRAAGSALASEWLRSDGRSSRQGEWGLDTEPVIRIAGLSKHFGAFQAVRDVSVEVRRGEILGFLGPNGAGKTTTISMLCGLLQPDAGSIELFGQRVRPGDVAARTRIGMCPQENVLWDRLTCREQLLFVGSMYGLGGKSLGRRADELLEQLDLADKRNRAGSKLSGGMRRRLSLALALIHDPEIVVLDEPEAGLDPQGRVTMREFVRGLGGNKTVVLTTHNLDEADRVSDRVAIIDHGSLLVIDTPEALKTSVGPGDVLELDVPEDATEGTVRSALTGVVDASCVTLLGCTVRVRVPDAVDRLAASHQALTAAGLPPTSVRLRATTLEDVFLSLTGRGLQA
jgi:ABC-2 type transport system ATP-binding protein